MSATIWTQFFILEINLPLKHGWRDNRIHNRKAGRMTFRELFLNALYGNVEAENKLKEHIRKDGLDWYNVEFILEGILREIKVENSDFIWKFFWYLFSEASHLRLNLRDKNFQHIPIIFDGIDKNIFSFNEMICFFSIFESLKEKIGRPCQDTLDIICECFKELPDNLLLEEIEDNSW